MSRPQDMNGSSGDNEIGTPRDLWRWLDWRYKFTFDAFASHENALVRSYATSAGTFFNTSGPIRHVVDGMTPHSPEHMDAVIRNIRQLSDEDGLTVDWADRVVFWNPPYGRGIFHDAITKAIDERNSVRRSVGLVKYDPSTDNGRLLRDHFHLEYLPRIRYEGMTSAATFSSVLAINKPDKWSR